MSKSKKGETLELSIFDLIKNQIDNDEFIFRKNHCRIFRGKGYYSRDRESNIIFDVSIEVSYPGVSDYSILMLVECKNYSHSVPVDDVEEFFAKTQQVGAANTKAILISTNSFQSGAIKFAKSKGIGIARYYAPESLKWELYRSPAAGYFRSENFQDIEAAIENQGYRSSIFDLYMRTSKVATNSLWVFFEDLIGDLCSEDSQFSDVRNWDKSNKYSVPYILSNQMESAAQKVLDMVGYEEGHVDLDAICHIHPKAKGLKVERILRDENQYSDAVLGRITFNPLKIELFISAGDNSGRERFTLAHEIAHLLLGHDKYMRGEYTDEGDLKNEDINIRGDFDIKRMEYQANYFASCILMPRENFLMDFARLLCVLDVQNKGFGALYVDHQECNINNYMNVTGKLMKFYGASRSAVVIRLKNLNLIKDVRESGVGNLKIDFDKIESYFDEEIKD